MKHLGRWAHVPLIRDRKPVAPVSDRERGGISDAKYREIQAVMNECRTAEEFDLLALQIVDRFKDSPMRSSLLSTIAQMKVMPQDNRV